MILSLLYSISYWTVLTLIFGLILYMGFWFFYLPLWKRSHFGKYPFVYMTKRFIPLMGDFKDVKRDYEDKGKFMGNFFRDKAIEKKGTPYIYFNAGMFDWLWVNDPSLFTEFAKLIPSKLDREPIDNTGFGRIGGTGGVSQLKSTKAWELRRNSFLKHIGINYASRFIPIMIKACENRISNWETG